MEERERVREKESQNIKVGWCDLIAILCIRKVNITSNYIYTTLRNSNTSFLFFIYLFF